MPVKLVVDRDAKKITAEPAKQNQIIRLKNKVELKMETEGRRWTLQVRKQREKA